MPVSPPISSADLLHAVNGGRKQGPRWYDAMPCYLSVQDRQLRIVEMNDLFRRDFSAVVGERCYRAYKRREEPCPDCPILMSFVSGQRHTAKQVVRMKDGRQVQVVVTSSPLFDEAGQVSAVVEMFTDVSEISALHQQLRRSRREYERLFDLVPCLISVQDRDYRIIQTNRLFRETFGERVGQRCYRVYKGREAVCENCPVEKSFADGAVHSGEECVTTRDGRQAQMVVRSAPLMDEEGAVAAVMEVSTDVSEVKRLQSLATVGLAVTGMAHRIKNILMGLKGGVFMVNEGFEDDDRATIDQGWQMVGRNVDKVAHVASDLLFCSKDRKPKLRTGVSPCEIAREVDELFRSRAQAEGIDLQLDLQPHQGIFDPDGLLNLLTNLVGNALDACRFDPEADEKRHVIRLRCALDAQGATVFEVQDNGAGIPAELTDKVFDGFFSTKGTEGTGLGLLVVRKVVEEHGGTISFSSQEGQGTRFRLVLPSSSTKARIVKPADPKGGSHEQEDPDHR